MSNKQSLFFQRGPPDYWNLCSIAPLLSKVILSPNGGFPQQNWHGPAFSGPSFISGPPSSFSGPSSSSGPRPPKSQCQICMKIGHTAKSVISYFLKIEMLHNRHNYPPLFMHT